MVGRARALLHIVAIAGALAAPGCSSLSIARVQPENVAVGAGLRPVAVIQANAISAYVLFIPLPGKVNLDRVVNRMLIVAAKTIGADKIANLTFTQTPETGIWAVRKILGWRSAQATGVAVQIEAPADATADEGPEPAPSPGGLPFP